MRRRTFLGQLGAATAFAGLGPALPGLAGAAAPEAAPGPGGVAPSAVLAFIDAAAAAAVELHSLVVARHGRIAARGWWAPYRAEAPHSLYSLSKSFTSTAIGFAVAENRLKRSDRVVDFFPYQTPAKVDVRLAALRVEHLLTMSVGQASDATRVVSHSPDWVRTFLSLPLAFEPGSVFCYNSAASYMLSAIAQAVTGERIVDYLRPRLFDPLGMPPMHWAVSPQGVNTGGWGLSATTETLFRFGQFYLQQGRWNGRRLLPAEWIRQATAFKIQQPATQGQALSALQQTSDWHQGYGYQFWRCRHDGYRGDGSFGQFCIVLPRLDAVIALTARTLDLQGLLDLVWDHLLPGLEAGPLRQDPALSARLGERLAGLSLAPPAGARRSARYGGRREYRIAPNALGVERLEVAFDDDACRLAFSIGDRRYPIACGIGRWHDGETLLPGTPPEFTEFIAADTDPGHPTRIAAAGAWRDDSAFEMQWRYYETPHFDTVVLRFADDRVEASFLNSLTQMAAAVHPETRPVLNGRVSS
ncbi:MAG TPA: serine hydrolase [Nevskia sp.]|nr:serine hydrolase [Nevskia sp.]